jgi:hypothetical protein
VAAPPTASRESMQEEPGSSALVFAERTTAHPVAQPVPKGRCTRNLHTSCHPGTASTCHRKRRSSSSVVGRSRPGSPAPGRVAGTSAG